MERIEVPFEVKQIDEPDDGFLHVYGLANTYEIDLGNDETVPGAFMACIERLERNAAVIDGTRFKAMLPGLWQHDMSMPVGTYVAMKETPEGLYTHAIYPLDDTFVSGRLKPQLRVRSVGKLSIGYRAQDVSFYDDEDRGQIRRLEKIDLREISLVTFPMNEGAVITGMKGAVTYKDLPLASTSRTWDASAARKRIRDFTGSEDGPTGKYRDAFLWYDSDDADSFGAYKMPIADVIDGKLTAVPRAVFAAAAAVQGARGGVDIPEGDKAKVKAHIDQYYKKMDRESPFKSGSLTVHRDMLGVLSVRELDTLLRKGVSFNKQAAKGLLSCLDVKSLRDAEQDDTRDADKWRGFLADIKGELQ